MNKFEQVPGLDLQMSVAGGGVPCLMSGEGGGGWRGPMSYVHGLWPHVLCLEDCTVR